MAEHKTEITSFPKSCAPYLVRNNAHEIALTAVTKDGMALEHVKHQTEAICMAAVRQNGLALQFVDKQTPNICLAAVEQNAHALSLVRDDEIESRQENIAPSAKNVVVPVEVVVEEQEPKSIKGNDVDEAIHRAITNSKARKTIKNDDGFHKDVWGRMGIAKVRQIQEVNLNKKWTFIIGLVAIFLFWLVVGVALKG